MGDNQIIWICDSTGGISSPSPPAGWNVHFLAPEAARNTLGNCDCAAVVVDCPIEGWLPETLLEMVQRRIPAQVPVLVRYPRIPVAEAVRLAHLGVHQFLPDDADPFAVIERVVAERRSAGRSERPAKTAAWERLLVGESREMRQITEIIRLVGGRRATVLITGETGTGKEVAARALHLSGSRTGPMISVNCSALPESLLESELFGHMRGAFTGAWQSRAGRFEQANGGTIFLDEIGDMPLELQAKLLRVLQEREVQRLGGSETIKLDVRVVAATNCDLPARIEQGRFREDLYYRLNVVPLRMPPLRERPGDILVLARHFLEKICRAEGLPPKHLTPEAADRLRSCSWPGNVRQLENAIETAVALSGDRLTLAPVDFPTLGSSRSRPPAVPMPVVSVPDDGLDYESTLACIEKSILEQALLKTGGNKKAAAQMLRLKRTTLSAKVRSLAG
jgi:DNA-binding NtrC family response regulator